MSIGAQIQGDPYIAWLQKSHAPLFAGGGILWRSYQGCLVPASLKPQPVQLSPGESRDLLHQSGTRFLRYFTTVYHRPTEFWYTACNRYDVQALCKETRRQIRRGHERCVVRLVTPEWLAERGYACYLAAFARYRNAQPLSQPEFRQECLDDAGGPFDFWAAFVDGDLAGFMKCVLGNDYIACVVLKLDPHHLGASTSYALKDVALRHYVVAQGKTIYDGYRAVAHDTRAHDFFLRFGYFKTYCDLQVYYRPALAAFVKAVYPFQPALHLASKFSLVRKIEVLLGQERIRRSFAGTHAAV